MFCIVFPLKVRGTERKKQPNFTAWTKGRMSEAAVAVWALKVLSDRLQEVIRGKYVLSSSSFRPPLDQPASLWENWFSPSSSPLSPPPLSGSIWSLFFHSQERFCEDGEQKATTGCSHIPPIAAAAVATRAYLRHMQTEAWPPIFPLYSPHLLYSLLSSAVHSSSSNSLPTCLAPLCQPSLGSMPHWFSYQWTLVLDETAACSVLPCNLQTHAYTFKENNLILWQPC